jgi:hypothetical protein
VPWLPVGDNHVYGALLAIRSLKTALARRPSETAAKIGRTRRAPCMTHLVVWTEPPSYHVPLSSSPGQNYPFMTDAQAVSQHGECHNLTNQNLAPGRRRLVHFALPRQDTQSFESILYCPTDLTSRTATTVSRLGLQNALNYRLRPRNIDRINPSQYYRPRIALANLGRPDAPKHRLRPPP